LFIFLSGCAATNPPPLSKGHLEIPDSPIEENIPAPVTRTPYLPPPTPSPKQETYSVVVNDVPVKELLFALARDATLNVDIHPKIEGNVTINAVNQTLIQILNRISQQISLVYELEGQNLFISPDLPFLRSYRVDYINMSRKMSSTVSVSTRIATAGGSVDNTGSSGSGASSGSNLGNTSQTAVTSNISNDFWATLAKNLSAILDEKKTSSTDASDTSMGEKKQTSSTDNNSEKISNNIIINPISGIVTVRASSLQHKDIQRFLDLVMTNAQRQVLIEATIVEVKLSDRYQAGIDWAYIEDKGSETLEIASSLLGSNLTSPPTFTFDLNKGQSDKIQATVRMLEEFGDTKILSSPKIIALNNQTALLKVVDEQVWFSITLERERDLVTNVEFRNYSSEIHTVPVGVIMAVTPQINKNGNVSLSIRPTITRVTGYAVDPVPRLLDAKFDNLVPQIQISEMESLLQVQSGQTVVLGGLMQNVKNKKDVGLPYLSSLPGIGGLFKYKDDIFEKTEIVIFLRPIMISNNNTKSTFRSFGHLLPSENEKPSLIPSTTGRFMDNG